MKEDRNFTEILHLGRKQIDGLVARRNDEVERLWSGFARVWTGAMKVDVNESKEILKVVLERGRGGEVECKMIWRSA